MQVKTININAMSLMSQLNEQDDSSSEESDHREIAVKNDIAALTKVESAIPTRSRSNLLEKKMSQSLNNKQLSTLEFDI